MFKRSTGASAIPNPETFIVQASNVSSLEIYQYAGGENEPVLKDVTLDIRRGECWGILGEEPFELALLTEIIGCVRPYGSGRVVLVERGMMRKKRKILPHVFYISGGDTVFSNMTTLEYLMFVTANQPTPARQRQAEILTLLLDTGLYYLTMVPIKRMTAAQKAVVSLMAAGFSKALLVIFSVSQLEFDQRLCAGIKGIADVITKRGGALLIASRDCAMVQAACTHTAFLLRGRIMQNGTMEEMLARLDRRVYVMQCADPQTMAESISRACPELRLKVLPAEVHIYDFRDPPISQQRLLTALQWIGKPFEGLRVSTKNLENAYKEVLASYDL